ncbi:MAG: hypothetical protein NVS1B13_19090 [Flavisolibacter sp.]
MQSFSIRDIEHLTGIKAHTLRIWEQRYNVFTAKRRQSLHRFYDNEDLKKLLRISFLYHQGLKISKLAELSEPDIITQVQNTLVASGNYPQHVNRLLEAAMDFNAPGFAEILKNVKQEIGLEKCMTVLCYPYLKKLGVLWSTNSVIPAQEHFSSYLIQNMIIAETDLLGCEPKPAEIILCTPEGEYHELPLLYINYLLKKNGWATLYLGLNLKASDMKVVCETRHINTIYMHILTNFTGMDTEDYLRQLCLTLPEINIFVSGEGIQKIQSPNTQLRLLQSDQQIQDLMHPGAKSLAGHRF